MAKHAFNQLWIDGFNLFYKWNRTRELFKSGCDINNAQQESIRELAIHLGNWRNRSILFMDGGPEASAMTLHGLRIRYPGGGKKADGLLEEFARGRTGNLRILAVTSDRALAATLRRNRLQIMPCEKFIREFLTGSSRSTNYSQKQDYKLSPEEVEEWLKLFSDDD